MGETSLLNSRKGNEYLKEYHGELGDFVYDSRVFELEKQTGDSDILHKKKDYSGAISLPKVCISCYNMFYDINLEGCWFEDFDTSDVKDMSWMFANCKLPEGFLLGDKFDTSSVKDMSYMFEHCKLPEGFSLGDKFDTSKVESMLGMFVECYLLDGFTLGDKFDTSSVDDMRWMFEGCNMHVGFSLGDKFDTSNVWNMHEMFMECQLPEGFSLGDKFNTSSVKWMDWMFAGCSIQSIRLKREYTAIIDQIRDKSVIIFE